MKYLVLILIISVSACASVPRPQLDFSPGATVETLSSEVSLSIHTADSSMGGHGYLLYRRPDQLHLLVLSPFGNILFEVFAMGERITLVYPPQSTAFSGSFDELPDKGGLREWRLMHWVMEVDPPGKGLLNGSVERMAGQGFMEKVTFENGLVTAKTSPDGDQVFYSNYTVVNGVPVAGAVELRNRRDERIRIKLEGPDVNVPLDDASFQPRLNGFTVLPLSALQGE